jgi:hypothetical protein
VFHLIGRVQELGIKMGVRLAMRRAIAQLVNSPGQEDVSQDEVSGLGAFVAGGAKTVQRRVARDMSESRGFYSPFREGDDPAAVAIFEALIDVVGEQLRGVLKDAFRRGVLKKHRKTVKSFICQALLLSLLPSGVGGQGMALKPSLLKDRGTIRAVVFVELSFFLKAGFLPVYQFERGESDSIAEQANAALAAQLSVGPPPYYAGGPTDPLQPDMFPGQPPDFRHRELANAAFTRGQHKGSLREQSQPSEQGGPAMRQPHERSHHVMRKVLKPDAAQRVKLVADATKAASWREKYGLHFLGLVTLDGVGCKLSRKQLGDPNEAAAIRKYVQSYASDLGVPFLPTSSHRSGGGKCSSDSSQGSEDDADHAMGQVPSDTCDRAGAEGGRPSDEGVASKTVLTFLPGQPPSLLCDAAEQRTCVVLMLPLPLHDSPGHPGRDVVRITVTMLCGSHALPFYDKAASQKMTLTPRTVMLKPGEALFMNGHSGMFAHPGSLVLSAFVSGSAPFLLAAAGVAKRTGDAAAAAL